MIPPEFGVPVPATVKLPLVLLRMMPLVPLPFAETVVSDSDKGIVAPPPVVRLISTAGRPLAAGDPIALIVPLEMVIIPLLATAFVACSPR